MGYCEVGQSETGGFLVSNTGTAPLGVTSITMPNYFTANPYSFTLNPGETQSVTVTFAPGIEGSLGGSVQVVSNAVVFDEHNGSFGIGAEGVLPWFDIQVFPAGGYVIGSPTDELGRNGDEQQYTATLTRDFVIGVHEVPFRLWDVTRDWALQNGYTDLNEGVNGAQPPINEFSPDWTGSHPVIGVTWYDIVKWLNAFSEKDGLTPCYTVGGNVYRTGDSNDVVCDFTADGYRLPTEAEWETACRAGATTAFYSGPISDAVIDPVLDGVAWYAYTSQGHTYPIGLTLSNSAGLTDTHGNVPEWCWDWYDIYPIGTSTDPVGPPSGTTRILRGGGFQDYAAACRSAARNLNVPDAAYEYGFRIAGTPPAP
jgi:formylglycine-generating enzyme required for sulfatase activity